MTTEPPPEARPLPDPPTDGVTVIQYLPKKSASLLASSSWDGSVRLHDTTARSAVLSHGMESGPLLSLATPSGMDAVATGGLDGSIRILDIPTSTYRIVGQHSTQEESKPSVACSCLASMETPSSSILASAGWHSSFHLWDVRQPAAAMTVPLPGKAFGMDVDVSHNRVVVITSGRRTCFLDLRHASGLDCSMSLERESSLKYQSRTVRFFPGGNGIALGSIEGRVAVENLEELGMPPITKKYAFKCHRRGDDVYPVNCIEFHPRFGTFCTGGCDGTVVLWDGLHKKKLGTLPKFATSIADVAFNHDGSELAIASSYTFEDGEREHPNTEIFVRKMLESECAPKTAK